MISAGDVAANMMAELKAKSSFYQQIEAQVKEYTPVLERLAQIIREFVPANVMEMREFRFEMDETIENLVDEAQVLKRIESWPFLKAYIFSRPEHQS